MPARRVSPGKQLINLWIPKHLHARLKQIKEDTGVPMTWTMIRALEHWLEHEG